MKEKQRMAVLWTALGKTAAKEASRDELAAGASHELHLSIAGTIDGETVGQTVRATLTVGHDSLKASSSGPKPAEVIACVLDNLNEATREAILKRLPERFAAMGQLPDVPASLVKAAERLLGQLRNAEQSTQRGPVACRYQLGTGDAG